MSSGFMDHRSDVSSGFRKPFHAKESNHAKRILEGKEELCSGHGDSTYKWTYIFQNYSSTVSISNSIITAINTREITVGYSENLGSASTRKLSTNNITTIG